MMITRGCFNSAILLTASLFAAAPQEARGLHAAREHQETNADAVASADLFDRDGDNVPDATEDQLAREFQPRFLYGSRSEECGAAQLDAEWCRDGNRPARHLPAFLGYDVVDLGFGGLYAIEFTLFLDR